MLKAGGVVNCTGFIVTFDEISSLVNASGFVIAIDALMRGGEDVPLVIIVGVCRKVFH
jgi:hypothetical protein